MVFFELLVLLCMFGYFLEELGMCLALGCCCRLSARMRLLCAGEFSNIGVHGYLSGSNTIDILLHLFFLVVVILHFVVVFYFGNNSVRVLREILLEAIELLDCRTSISTTRLRMCRSEIWCGGHGESTAGHFRFSWELCPGSVEIGCTALVVFLAWLNVLKLLSNFKLYSQLSVMIRTVSQSLLKCQRSCSRDTIQQTGARLYKLIVMLAVGLCAFTSGE